jgi:benzoyl-CoA reductase/2-hydroxyglutaryl-CoA dehydratase subunit BcrC/BadD/HgdB
MPSRWALCAGAEFGFEEAERFLPRNTCALIKSFFGFKLSRVCPYIESTDLLVGETTCDGKKKAYEAFKEIQSNLYVLEVPQMKAEPDRQLLRAEYRRFMAELEAVTGVTITAERLKRAIGIVNSRRRALHRLAALRAANPAPISGLDALLVTQVSFYDNPVRFTDAVNKLCDELETRVEKGVGVAPRGAKRILLSGCPMAVPNWKLPFVIETSGAVVVGEESCTGERGYRNLVDDAARDLDGLFEAIVDRYFKIDCAIFTPNPERLEHIVDMAKQYQADGVIHYALQFCSPYTVESYGVEKTLNEKGIPVLRVETDYSQEDAGQLKTRIEAFLEMLGR